MARQARKGGTAATPLALVGDIGGTNARFALVQPDGSLARVRTLATEDHPTLADAIAFYFAKFPAERPDRAVLAVAAPVTGDQVSMTNHPWRFSIAALQAELGLARLRVINDFVANALAIPHLAPAERAQVGGGAPLAGAPAGVLGPGTGLGVSALVPSHDGFVPIQGEGGHVTMAPADARESAVLDLMRRRYAHVSAERVLCGPGLVNLYNALCELDGVPAAALSAAQITDPRTEAEEPQARAATAMFCAMLGTVAGNLALTLGARGGIYIAGGIVPRLGAAFAESAFRARFEDKGRLRAYLAEIPTYVMTRSEPALLGAASLVAVR
ncbi:MAG: glucokinase [Bradyrhizobiaceae bacterium]|nr:MAG: glucokinase [Bradyrhizobiaceae bacterium]